MTFTSASIVETKEQSEVSTLSSRQPELNEKRSLKTFEEDLYSETQPFVEPYDKTFHIEPRRFLTLSNVKLIGRIANGILKVKRAPYKVTKKISRKSKWYFCGESLEDEEAKEMAAKWAFIIVHSVWLEKYDPPEDDRVYGYRHVIIRPYNLNPWAVAGLAFNESSFDLCALGLGPRFKAYETGLLKRRKRHITHTKEEVLKIVTNKSMIHFFKKSGFDLGGLQELTNYHPGQEPGFLLTWEGFRKQIHYLANRGRFHETKRPWRHWPGHDSEWKDVRVVGFARRLGATKEDLKSP